MLYATAKEAFKAHLSLNTKDFTLSSINDVQYIFKLDDFRGYDPGTLKMKFDQILENNFFINKMINFFYLIFTHNQTPSAKDFKISH